MAENSNQSDPVPNCESEQKIDLDSMNDHANKYEQMSKEEYLAKYGQQLADDLANDILQADIEKEMNEFEDEIAKQGISSSIKGLNINDSNTEGEPCLTYMYTGNCFNRDTWPLVHREAVVEMSYETAEFVPSSMLPTAETTEESKDPADDVGDAWFPRAMNCICCYGYIYNCQTEYCKMAGVCSCEQERLLELS